jgi:peptide/nickel transport system permease protein
MLKYICKRLAYAVLVLLGVSLIMYFLVRLMPVDFIQNKIDAMNQGGTVVQLDTQIAMYDTYGLEYPDDLIKDKVADLLEKGETAEAAKWEAMIGGDNGLAKMQKIFKGYFTWLSNLARLDLGISFKYGIPVEDKIAMHMGTSFAVAFIATIFEFMIAIPLGITAATHQYSLRDYLVTVLVMVGISLPSFFFGNILKNVLALEPREFFRNIGLQIDWLYASGLTDATVAKNGFLDILWDYFLHAFIPILTIVILSIGGRMRMTRTNMLEVMNSDYIRTARAKGLKEKVVIYKHAFRNTLIPLVTSMAGLLPSLFSGAIITEQVFDLPGIGNYALQAMNVGDIPFIMGYNMFLALLSVLGVILADLAYGLVDPRVKLQ